MNSLLHDYSTGILDNPEPPCLSLYQPTHRTHPDNQQDPIRFRNLLNALAQSVQENHPRYNSETGEVQFGGDAVDDVLDDMAELVLHHRGQVVIVPNKQMPTQTGIATIYRF